MVLSNQEKQKLNEIVQRFDGQENSAFQFLSTETKGEKFVCTIGQYSGDPYMKPFILASLMESFAKENPQILLQAIDIVTDKDNRRIGRLVDAFSMVLGEILDNHEKDSSNKDC